MNPLERATRLMEVVAFIKEEMKKMNLKTAELAALSNLNTVTVSNLLEGRTYSPHWFTVESLFGGLGYVQTLPKGNSKILRYKLKPNKPGKDAVNE